MLQIPSRTPRRPRSVFAQEVVNGLHKGEAGEPRASSDEALQMQSVRVCGMCERRAFPGEANAAPK